MKSSVLAVIVAAALACQSAFAAPSIQVTEMWGGGLPGSEATSDWFELTNIGDMPATGLDGNIYYDDDSFDATKDSALIGIDTIAPGESVIYVVSWEDDYPTSGDAIAAFTAMWGAPANDLSGVQIGYVDDGGGLGGGGDSAVIFDGNTIAATPIDFESYSVSTQVESFVSAPDGSWFDNTFAQVGVWGAYESNLNVTSSLTTPAVGSPGTIGVIPEPSSMILAALGMLVLAARRQ